MENLKYDKRRVGCSKTDDSVVCIFKMNGHSIKQKRFKNEKLFYKHIDLKEKRQFCFRKKLHHESYNIFN